MLRQMLLAYRFQKQIAVKDMAKAIGIDQTALWRFEQGKNIHSTKLLKILNFITDEKLSSKSLG